MIALEHNATNEIDYFVEYKPVRLRPYFIRRLPLVKQLDAFLFFFRVEHSVSNMLEDFKAGQLEITKGTLDYSRVNLRLSNMIGRVMGNPYSFLISKRLNKNIDKAYELERLVRKSYFSNPENRGPKDPLAEAVAYSGKKMLERHYARSQKG